MIMKLAIKRVKIGKNEHYSADNYKTYNQNEGFTKKRESENFNADDYITDN